MIKRFKIGVIGLGARGEGFARQLYEGTERAELFGLCDIDADRATKFIEYCGVQNARYFQDPKEFMAQKDMDGVMITTPDFTHLDVVALACAAKKPFYLEKPMEVTVDRCREIIRLVKKSGVATYMGFNMRASPVYSKMKEIADSGILGQIVHIEGLEQLSFSHSASFMRRFHRYRARSGGLINTKSSHDMDVMHWMLGYRRKLRRVSAFGGVNVFRPEKAPAQRCSQCPRKIWRECRYRDVGGFVFPVGSKDPIHKTQDTAIYGGDLCCYNSDKDIVDNMSVIFEWDDGVRGNFNLQLFQAHGRRASTIWGENGILEYAHGKLEVIESPSGNRTEHFPVARSGGHGGTDPCMLGRFLNTLEQDRGQKSISGLYEGMAATVMAVKAEEAMLAGKVLTIDPKIYDI